MTKLTLPGLPGLTRRTLLQGAAALGAAGIVAMPHVARAADSVRFSLEFRIYGGNAPFFYGVEKGFFKDLGIDIQLDGSAGSGEAVRRIASGTHEFATADFATVVEFVGRNPTVGLKSAMMVFDNFPAVVLSLKRKPLTKLDQLVGARIGVAASSAATRILPALLKAHNIDPTKIDFVNIDVKLRDTLLLKGEVDAVIAFDYTAIFNLMESGVKQEDIVLLYYSENGFAAPGNSFVASKAMMETKPDLTKRMAQAIARCWVEGNKDREGCIAAVSKRERLLDPKVELARLNFVYAKHVLTKNVMANGLGAVTNERLVKSIGILTESLDLKPEPSVAQVYDDQFLPPLKDRRFT
ncbi:ABC transporter substrate-binding protein [Aquabacter spiritensis]|uniref:Thiamine pyrimidine synthase n=1 Tax=Aquabacter spiritensis TaxID=933073 RepID=A0A4R3M0V5_9HYPH|nr:ABC transporter substrate-binding protein [Aquabacter spiritensis]TCT06721.1 NitT/TauT family transport system substrate-binding protein [Aquabacter spiritensis]